jgi:hypothetical protein
MDGELNALLAKTLVPNEERLDRVRGHVLAAFHSRQVAVEARRPRRVRGWAMATLFSGLLLATSGLVVAAASGPGQPFYAVRLAINNMMLPSSGTARDHGLAEELDTRLAEARSASERGDAAALLAALDAYRQTLHEFGKPPLTDAWILTLLGQHRALLESLVNGAPAAAQEGLRKALADADHAANPSSLPRESPPASRRP